ncbi:MAG: helix-turn-helix domain-containing protein [Gammaproteobacteria bacterium]|nr:helix-turn-helix domain-containing protein [Gammaproteobacteria bacterium]
MDNKIVKLSILNFSQAQSFSHRCAEQLFVSNLANAPQWYVTQSYNWDEFKRTPKNEIANSDTLVVSDINPEVVQNEPSFADVLERSHQRGSRLVAFGTGVLALAMTGLLNGKQAAVDSQFLDLYSSKFPQVNFCSNIPFTQDGQLYCSASNVAALLLGVRIIAQDWQNDIANKVAKILHVNYPLFGYSDEIHKVESEVKANKLDEVLAWAESNLKHIDNLDELASRCYMSRRNFDRQFRSVYKKSPKKWLTEKKIALAIQYLNNRNMPIEDIATASGFSSAVNFRNNFKTHLGVSPSEYRAASGIVSVD